MAEVIKIGAYLCKGCGLGERLNFNALEAAAKRAGKAGVVRSHALLCGQEGVAMIRADIQKEGVNRVMIGGCSRRAKTEAFHFEGISISRANLREGVIWVRPNTPEAKETTQEMAEDYVRMGCAEVRRMTNPIPNPAAVLNRQILVVGGGISGMTAAIEAAKTGYRVAIVEKSDRLGGWAGKLYKRVADRYPFSDPVDTGLAALKKAIEANAKITVHLNATVTKTSGAPGRFAADITTADGKTITDNFGSIIQASGFTRYDIANLPEMGGGSLKDVVDQAGLEALAVQAAGGAIKRPSDGHAVRSVAFVQCAGQRSEKLGHLPYCSGFCCSTSIKQAMYFKDQNPEIDAVVLFSDLRTPGAAGEDFYRSGQKKGISFSKGTVTRVTQGPSGPVVHFHDEILNDDVNLPVDLVVLATGQVANAGVDIETLSAPQVAGSGAPAEQKVSVLNLDYRQGPDLPQLKHGFADSHFICFPYETRRTGIYTAGPVRRPMDIAQAMEDATGATLKAISALENAGLGRAAHPRSGDLSFPTFRREGCTQCKRCTVECPFGAIDEDEKRYPQFNEARCRRCGTCMGACPVRVISFENYSVETVGQQLKSLEIPDEFSGKPRVLIFACENDAYPALDMAAQNRLEYSAYVRVIPVRCLGSVNTIWLNDALNSGYDGIMLMGCQKGENYQCHFVKGSEMAHYRMSKIGDTLKGMNLDIERVTTYEVAITDIHRIPKLINDYIAMIEKIGPSPFKGF
ncbi:quinone-modifying oxidoreductase, subunit QmoB [Gammaproteobacteria bacterium]